MEFRLSMLENFQMKVASPSAHCDYEWSDSGYVWVNKVGKWIHRCRNVAKCDISPTNLFGAKNAYTTSFLARVPILKWRECEPSVWKETMGMVCVQRRIWLCILVQHIRYVRNVSLHISPKLSLIYIAKKKHLMKNMIHPIFKLNSSYLCSG